MLKVSVPCPPDVVGTLVTQLRGYGCEVTFESLYKGRVTHLAGVVEFEYVDAVLHATLALNNGYFADKLLIGGIRQLIEEAVEDVALASVVTDAHVWEPLEQ